MAERLWNVEEIAEFTPCARVWELEGLLREILDDDVVVRELPIMLARRIRASISREER